MPEKFHLISNLTCPWVQRAVITLRAKAVDFEITFIDLRDKPDWFLKISPHGKVPVLLVDDQPLFESNAIAEYLDETFEPRLHPADPIKRARNRAWTDFIPDFARALISINYGKPRRKSLKRPPPRQHALRVSKRRLPTSAVMTAPISTATSSAWSMPAMGRSSSDFPLPRACSGPAY